MGRYAEREAALDALQALLDAGGTSSPPPGREWRLELAAERAIDIGRRRELDAARRTAEHVIGQASPTHRIALGRAHLALGQALAWVGTDEATRRAHHSFAEAADHFAALGEREWQGSALLRRGYSASYQYGDLRRAQELIRQALDTYDPESHRLPGALVSYADVLVDLGEFERADRALDRASTLAIGDEFNKLRSDLAWTRARVAAGRGDARATERLLRETERDAAGQDWFETHIGLSFLLEGAALLDLVGLGEQANNYLQRARERAGDDDDEVMQTSAVLRARSGDPAQALDELQELARGDWLEKRLIWRHTLLTAWATFRAGRTGAGELAARAFEQAVACGGAQVAQAGERDLVAALAPLAEQSGSAVARELMLAGRHLVVRLTGTPTVTAADGSLLELPAGLPARLVRLLALHEHGLAVDMVLEVFFPDAGPAVARQRLRQVLKRLRASAGDVVLRDGETLRLVPAWVDVREFLLAANRVRGAQSAHAVTLAYAALTRLQGPVLSSDPYDAWAEEARSDVSYRHLALLDLVADAAVARSSHQEAVTALEAALEVDPDADDRRVVLVEQLKALGRHAAATHLARERTSASVLSEKGGNRGDL
jgi:DNA-binding SARP family transcriptional activator/tetratricopeptide (TPR) repeat protein